MEFIKKIWNKIKFLLKYLGNGKKSEYNNDIEFKKNDTRNSYNNNIRNVNGKVNIVNGDGEINIVNGEQVQQ